MNIPKSKRRGEEKMEEIKMSLYEMSQAYNDLLSMLYNEDIDEEKIIEYANSLEDEIEVKADNYAKLMTDIQGSIDAIKKQIDRLSDRKAVFENKIAFLKKNLEAMMKETGKSKFKTDLFTFNIQKNPPALQLANEPLILEWALENRSDLITIKDPVLNKSAIKAALKEGETIEGAELVQSESLRIK